MKRGLARNFPCPKCSTGRMFVKDTRERSIGGIYVLFRRRHCNDCSYRNTTAEFIIEKPTNKNKKPKQALLDAIAIASPLQESSRLLTHHIGEAKKRSAAKRERVTLLMAATKSSEPPTINGPDGP